MIDLTQACITSVANGYFVDGLNRLDKAIWETNQGMKRVWWRDKWPPGSPSHRECNYAFKGYALEHAVNSGDVRFLIWADSSIVPLRRLDPILEIAAEQGAWVSNNGFTNYQWTQDSAYKTLFPHLDLEPAREMNKTIKHVVAGFFVLDLHHQTGAWMYSEFVRLAKSGCFHGPHSNDGSIGPPDVLGHRHCQSALSVIAWRARIKLTDPPNCFCYDGAQTEATVAVARGIGK